MIKLTLTIVGALFCFQVAAMKMAHGSETTLVCEGQLECPTGCWNSEDSIVLALSGSVMVKAESVTMSLDPLFGVWEVAKNKETEERIFFDKTSPTEGYLTGSLGRYTGELIVHNAGATDKGAPARLKVYAKLKCKPAKKLF